MEQLKFHTNKLRALGLRPTKQRLAISKILFNRKETFHFTIEQLKKMIEKNVKKKISLATLYNTIHAFKKKGYLKEILINSSQSYFDTNTTDHHHFFDEKQKELIDLENKDIDPIKIKTTIPGKKVKSVEVIVRVDTDN